MAYYATRERKKGGRKGGKQHLRTEGKKTFVVFLSFLLFFFLSQKEEDWKEGVPFNFRLCRENCHKAEKGEERKERKKTLGSETQT